MQKPFKRTSKSCSSKWLLSHLGCQSAGCWVMNPQGTQKFRFFSCNMLCCPRHRRSVPRDCRDCYLHSARVPHCLTVLKKWWPRSLPFAKCAYFVAEGGMSPSSIPHSSWVSLCGWKNGWERKWFKFSYVRERQQSTLSFRFCQSSLPSDAAVLVCTR